MFSQYLIPDLQRDEACRLIAYPDPRSGGAPWTIGYGHTGRDVHPGLVWTIEQAHVALDGDVTAMETGLTSALPWVSGLTPLRQDCLGNMAFNLGVHGLMEFTDFLGLVKSEKYPLAALDLRGTPWYHQVGDRAVRIAHQLVSNIHQE